MDNAYYYGFWNFNWLCGIFYCNGAEHERYKEIIDYDESAKVVMITAAGQQNKVIEALKIGAEKFITKPYEKEEVIATMEALLK